MAPFIPAENDPTKSAMSVYVLNTTDQTDYGANGLVVELDEVDVSLNIDPSYAEALATLGGLSADATATVDWTPTNSKLFQYQFDSDDLVDASDTDIKFKLGQTAFTGLTVSSAKVVSGNINSGGGAQTLDHDLVRHLALKVTGGYASADIFSNEAALVSDVASQDSDVVTAIHTETASHNNFAMLDDTSTDRVTRVATNYLRAILNNPTNDSAPLNYSYKKRYDDLISDLSGNSGASNTAELELQSGDAVVVKVNFGPKSPDPLNAGVITNRSYKVMLVVK